MILNLPFACNPCGPFDNRPYKIVSMSSFVGSVIENSFIEELSVDFEIAAIRIMIDETERIGFNNPVNLWITNSAYACSPPEPNVQMLDQIKITSLENIISGGVEFKSGENLNSLFKILDQSMEYNVNDFIERQNRSPWSFSMKQGFILFQLIAKPDVSINQKFTFTFTFDDGLEYQVLTPVFEID